MIHAPQERCFDLARDMGVHEKTTGSTGERVIEVISADGRRLTGSDAQNALLESGDVVTFEARHLGIRQRLNSKIVAYDRPNEFTDEMQKGAFRSMRHIHRFEPCDDGTKMVDILEFESPLWIAGKIVDRLFLAGYMKRFLIARGQELGKLARETLKGN